jgi:hypothetical protein
MHGSTVHTDPFGNSSELQERKKTTQRLTSGLEAFLATEKGTLDSKSVKAL